MFTFCKRDVKDKGDRQYDKRHDHRKNNAHAGAVYGAACAGKSVPADLQRGRQHHRGPFCGKGSAGSSGNLQSHHNTDDSFSQWPLYGCQHPDGDAVWSKRLPYTSPPDQHHYDIRNGLFHCSYRPVRDLCRSDSDADAGGSFNYGNDEGIPADYFLGYDVYLFV